MASTRPPEVLINGHTATLDRMAHLALVNYGHFTAMQIRGGATRGLGYHLDRLRTAHLELFGSLIDTDEVLRCMRVAIASVRDAYLRVTLFEAEPGAVSVMTVVRPPVEPDSRPQSLLPVDYVRPFAHIKHVGSFAQIRYGDQAERAGYNDALLVGSDGRIAETTIANIGFIDGDKVIWPDAPSLQGVTWSLLDDAFLARGTTVRRAPITLDTLHNYDGAFVTNSIGLSPVARIGEHNFDVAAIDAIGAVALLNAEPLERI